MRPPLSQGIVFCSDKKPDQGLALAQGLERQFTMARKAQQEEHEAAGYIVLAVRNGNGARPSDLRPALPPVTASSSTSSPLKGSVAFQGSTTSWRPMTQIQ